MRKLSLSVFLFFVLFSAGCSFTGRGKIENAIDSKIREVCESNRICSIRVDEITWFDWDSLVVFSGGFTAVDKNRVLGKNYFNESHYGFSITIVLLKDGEIVYSEENFRDMERNRDGDTYFSDVDPSKHYRMYPRNSVFEVERQRLSDGEYYSLKCINCID